MPYKNKGFYLKEKKFKGKVFDNHKKLTRLLTLVNKNKYSAPKLAKVFGCNCKTIHYTLYNHGTVLPNRGRFTKWVYCTEEFFRTLSPISAYWAGFIAADGCLNKRDNSMRLGLSKVDRNHLIKFKNSIKTNANITECKSNNSVRIMICSEKLYNSLTDLGIKPNKSLTINKVSIPKGLMSHFIRGVFDGDGSISGEKITHVQFMIAGNKPFLEQLQDTLIKKCELNKVKIYPCTDSKAFRIQYTGSQIFRILEYLYKDSTIDTRLDRKYKKYLELKSKFKT